jgi:hypothetical protein
MKMTLEYNDQFGMVSVAAEGIELRVIDTNNSWDKYFVVSDTGIRRAFYNDYSFENESGASDTEIFLFKTAYNFLEMKNARLQKLEEQKALELEEDSTEMPF